MLDLYERIIHSLANYDSNCHGSSFWWTDELPNDFKVDVTPAYQDHFKNMKKVELPVIGCYVVWERPDKYNSNYTLAHHSGLLVSLNPPTILHRKSTNGSISPFGDVNALTEEYVESYDNVEVTFRLPTKGVSYMTEFLSNHSFDELFDEFDL